MPIVTCYFCGAVASSSVEDFFPRWARKVLPIRTDVRAKGIQYNEHKLTRPGAVGTETLKDCCGACNNGWMSSLQTSARPVIEPWILGDRPIINEADAITLAKWAVMTCISVDGFEAEFRRIPEKDRRQFSADRTIPDDWQVYVGTFDGTPDRGWAHRLYDKDGQTGQYLFYVMGRMVILVWNGKLQAVRAAENKLFQLYPIFDEEMNASSIRISADTVLRAVPSRAFGFPDPPAVGMSLNGVPS